MPLVLAQDGCGECRQELAVGNATPGGLADDGGQVDLLTRICTARTEQSRMAGGSIHTLVEGGDAARHQLDLGVRDGPKFPAKIPHVRPS